MIFRKLPAAVIAGAAVTTLAVAPAFAQKSKNTFRTATDSPIKGVSYYLDPKPDSVFTARAIYDSIVYFDEKALKIKPLLAKSWKRIDSKTLEFELRSDVTWHDGEKFDANDVIHTFNWLTDKKTKIRFKRNWAHIDRFEKIGPNTVRMIAKRPTPFDLVRLAFLTPILPEHAHGQANNKLKYIRKPVGTSMYRAVKIDRNTGVFLERNLTYKHGGNAKPASNIGRIELLFVSDRGAQVAQYLAGNLEAVRSIELSQGEALAKRDDTELTIGQGISWRYMAIDAKGRSGNAALKNVMVRKALMMAVNIKDIAELTTGGHPISRTPEQMCWRLQAGCDFSKKAPGYDPATAKKLLAEAGYPKGFDLEITTFTTPSIKGAAVIVAAQLAKVGVKATITPLVIGPYRKKQRDGKIQMMVGGYPAGGLPDVAGTINFIYSPPPSRDYHGDAVLKKLGRQVNSTMDPNKRKALSRQLFDRAADQAYFKVLGPGPTPWAHKATVNIDAGAISAFNVHPEGLRWK